MKTCPKCKVAKSLEDFANHKSRGGTSIYCRDCHNLQRREYRHRNRVIVLNYYGKGEPKCVCCGETQYEFLAMDHIEGNGATHRKLIKYANIYDWLYQHQFPSGFQILCHNCNCAKGFYGQCPHKNLKEINTND